MNIHELLKEKTGQTIEFNLTIPSKQDLSKTICAFCNTKGGTIIIGIDPNTKEIIGLSKDLLFELHDTYKKIIRDLVEPLPSLIFKNIIHQDKELLAITVLPGNIKPYYLKGQDKLTNTYVRVGANNQVANNDFIFDLKRETLHISYDRLPVYDATVEDLDNTLIENFLLQREDKLNIPKVLINYAFLDKSKLITRENGQIYPTVASILCFSQKVNIYYPQAKIQCNIYNSNDNSKLVKSTQICGPIINQVNPVLDFFEMTDIPKEVLTELIVNAIIHRKYFNSNEYINISFYKNRLEVENPGYLPIGLTSNDLGNNLCIRKNYILHNIFNQFGYGYNHNCGIQTANKILKNSFMPPISFNSQGINFLATVYNDTVNDYFSKDELKILKFIENNEYITNIQCQKLLKIKDKQAQYILIKLVKRSKLRAVGDKKGRKYINNNTNE